MENPFQAITDELSEIKDLISKLSSVQPKAEPEADILNIKQAAKLLNLAPATIYNKVNKKEIPHFKQSKRLYFSKAGLIAWLKEGRKLTKAEFKEEVNKTLCSQQKSNSNSLPELVKKYTSTIDIENETPEEASSEAGQIHYFVNKDQLKKTSK